MGGPQLLSAQAGAIVLLLAVAIHRHAFTGRLDRALGKTVLTTAVTRTFLMARKTAC